MADDGKLDKLKEQYVDEIISIIPLAQAVFIVLMAISSDRLWEGKSTSVIAALSSFGLKSALGPDDGHFWEVSLFAVCLSFILALANLALIRLAVERSVRSANLGATLIEWQHEATLRTTTLTDAQKSAIQTSFKSEIEIRLKRYKAKRAACEFTFSVTCLSIYLTLLLILHAWKNDNSLQWSWAEAAFIAGSIWISWLLHRSSIRYAIAKILPLKIYAGVLSGEMVFFEEFTG